MPADFLPLVAALVIAAVVYILRERHRRRTRVDPARPDLTMPEAWEFWRAGGGCDPDTEFLPAEFVPPAPVEARAQASLLETERVLLASGGHRPLRQEILRDATTALYLEIILRLGEPERTVLLKGYQEGMDPLLRNVLDVSTLRWIVLRQYGRLKYDDAVPDDWFHQYLLVAGPYLREKVRLARDFLVELDAGAARLAEIYDVLLRELAERMLQSPRKKRYVRPDLAPTS